MKSETYPILTLLFVCAVVLTMTLEGVTLVEAKSLFNSPLFNGPPDGDSGGEKGPPPVNEKGEVDPGKGGEDMPVRDPETPAFTVIFPKGAIHDPVEIKFFSSGLPQGILLPPNAVSVPDRIVPTSINSPYFFFAAWKRIGEGGAIRQFDHSILIQAPYEDLGFTPAQEAKVRIWMYNPATQSWMKLGGRADIFSNVVTGLLSSTTPLEENGNTLFTLAIDDTPPLVQTIDKFGETTLSIQDRNDFRFQVLPGTVAVGTHFEVTSNKHIPDAASFQLLAKPVDIKAYHINHHQNNYTGDRQITDFSKPVKIRFDYEPDTVAKVGPKPNLTIVMLQNGQWVDVEDLGYKVIREAHEVRVETDKLGTFSLAVAHD